MRTNFFCTNFLKTPRGLGHPGKIPETSQIPPFETQGRQTFEREHELFGHHPFAWRTPTPPGGLRTQKVNVNLCALFSYLIDGFLLCWSIPPVQLGPFRKKFRKNSGKTPETLSERFLEFPSRVRAGDAPNPIIQGI